MTIETQMRRMADLAFFLQQYEVAFTTYHTVKKECGEKHYRLFAACEVGPIVVKTNALIFTGNAVHLSVYARLATT
jgi:hypothetical protein